MATGNPHSFLRVNRAELELDAGVDPHSPAVYERGRDNLRGMIRDGVLIRDTEPCLYVYALTRDGRTQTGLATLTSVDEYDRGLIKKHEHTRPDKVEDRAAHILTLDAQVGPVFSTYRSTDATRAAFAAVVTGTPTVDFVADDGVRHVFWVVGGASEIAAFQRSFGELPCFYIADGHHRSEAASVVRDRRRRDNPSHGGTEPYDFFLNVLFPDDELTILPYNRVIRDLKGVSLDALLAAASDSFHVEPSSSVVAPTEAGVGMLPVSLSLSPSLHPVSTSINTPRTASIRWNACIFLPPYHGTVGKNQLSGRRHLVWYFDLNSGSEDGCCKPIRTRVW